MSPRSHSMRVSYGIPALALRGVVLVVGGIAAVGLNDYPVWQIIGVLAFLLGAVLPQSLGGWAGAACIVLGMLTADPSVWRTAIALVVIHLVHVLGCVCLEIPARSRVHPRALLPTLRRFVVVEAIAQPIALPAVLLPAVGESGVAWLAPIGAVIAAGLAILFLRVQARR